MFPTETLPVGSGAFFSRRSSGSRYRRIPVEKQIENLIARLKAIDVEQAAIENKADLENSGKFSDEQRTAYDALQAEFEAKSEEKTELERQLSLRQARLARATNNSLVAATLPRRLDAATAAPALATTHQSVGTPIQREPELNEFGEPVIRFKIPRWANRIGNPRSFKGTVDGHSAEERAYRFGMWALHRISQDIPRFKFPLATQFVNDYMQATNSAHGETGGTTGADFLVPEEFSSDVIILREQYGVARKLFRRSVMTTDVKHEPKRLTGLTAYFVAEGSAGTESNMTWQDLQLIAKDIMCLSRISAQLSMDAVINVGDTLAGEMAYAFSNKEDDCAFNGTGTSTYGGINGVLNLLTDTDGAGTDSKGLTVGTSTGWAGLVLADFNKCAGTLPVYATTDNTCWVCHKNFYNSTMQRLEAAAGGNTIMTISQGDPRARPSFLGWPVQFSQIMPSATAAGVMCAFGDFSLGALFGDRQQSKVAFSEHATVNGTSVFEANQIAIRATERFDINVHGCGTSAAYGPIVGLSCG